MYSAVSVVTLSFRTCVFEESSVLSYSPDRSEQNWAGALPYSNWETLCMIDSQCQGINQQMENSSVSNMSDKLKICLINMILEGLITVRFNNIFAQNPG